MSCKVFINDVIYVTAVSLLSMLIGSMVTGICYMNEYKELKRSAERAIENTSNLEKYIVSQGYADYIIQDDVIMLKWK